MATHGVQGFSRVCKAVKWKPKRRQVLKEVK